MDLTVKKLFFLCFFALLTKDNSTAIQPPPQSQETPPLPTTVFEESETEITLQPGATALDQPLNLASVSGKQEIAVGASLPLKGESGLLGDQVFTGMSLFFNKTKKDKDSSFSIKLTTLDDRADFTKTQKNIASLKLKTPLFIGFLGTEPLVSLKEAFSDSSLAVFFPCEGTSLFRQSHYTNLVFFRTSHERELEALVDYAINKLNKKKFAVFYEASEWGESCLATARSILKKQNLHLVAAESYPQKTVNISNAVTAVSNAAPTAIICIAQPRPAYNFIRSIVNRGLHKTTFLGLSHLFAIQETLRKARGVNIIISSVVPDPFKSKLPLVAEYRRDMKKNFPNKRLSPASLEGYINAVLFFEAISHAQTPLTPQQIISYIETLQMQNFKGLDINFDDSTRTLSHQVWLNTGSQKEWSLFSNPEPKE